MSAQVVAAHATPVAPSRVSWACDSRWSWLREWSGVQPESPGADDLDSGRLPLTCRYRLSHGLQDAVVPATETITLGRQLEVRGADVEVLLLPGVGHAITSADGRSAWNRWIIETIWGEEQCV